MTQVSRPRRVALFITCLGDLFYPQVGEATVKILRRVGVQVDFPDRQTCCGQPAFNSGFQRVTRRLAEHFVDVFAAAECIVTPFGSRLEERISAPV
jgi:L-lactate dehydrogenase complex protein LldE